MTTAAFVLRLCLAAGFFNAANQAERPVLRAVGLAYLLGVGILGTLAAIAGGSWHAWVIGSGGLAAGGYAYWANR